MSYTKACVSEGITPAANSNRSDPRPSYKRKKTIQAKHLDTRKILEFIVDHCKKTGHLWTTFYDLEDGFPDWDKYPDKVIRAKMRSLVKQGYLNGCNCGCRGDFEPQGLAYYFLSKNRSRDDIKPGFAMHVDGRALRDMWWEGTTMCAQFHDTGAITKFYGANFKDYSIGTMQPDGTATITGTIQPATIEFISITFVIDDKKP
jgi:hypothetical protein